MDREEMRGLIRAALDKDGKITCAAAFEVAEKSGTSPGEIGKLINEMRIKIKGCRLGCF